MKKYDGQKLLEARLAKGWDQTTTAYHAGVSVSTISRVESGERGNPLTVRKIAKVLGVNLRDILIAIDSNGHNGRRSPAGAKAAPKRPKRR